MRNVPFLVFCALLNWWDLEATAALRQLWTSILGIKVSVYDHLVTHDPALACKVITPRTVIFQNKPALESGQLASWTLELCMNIPEFNYQKIIIFCQIIKDRADLYFPKIFILVSLPFTTYSFYDETSFRISRRTFCPGAGCCHVWQWQAPNLQSLCIFWTFWWQTVVPRLAELRTCVKTSAHLIKGQTTL